MDEKSSFAWGIYLAFTVGVGGLCYLLGFATNSFKKIKQQIEEQEKNLEQHHHQQDIVIPIQDGFQQVPPNKYKMSTYVAPPIQKQPFQKVKKQSRVPTMVPIEPSSIEEEVFLCFSMIYT